MADSTWTTRDEMDWLKLIGFTHEEAQKKEGSLPIMMGLSKSDLLRNYIESSYKRSNWGRIDKSVCIQFAKTLLSKSEGKDDPKKHR